MNHRLQQFLDLENISPAKLSDILGVQRSNISHILSGRNKPSFDFICKIISRFPSINTEWLLTGKGKPYKDYIYANSNLSGIEDKNTSYSPDNMQNSIDFSEEQPSENSINTASSNIAQEKRLVKRVIIFYNDGSFEELKPEK